MKIICIGRNYAEHAKELKNELPIEPLFFLKPDTALTQGNSVYYPEFTQNLHYEAELVLKIGKTGKYIDEKYAYKYVNEYSLGVDFTARDLQDECKTKGLPWEKAKAFDGSAVVGQFLPLTRWDDLKSLDFKLLKNGDMVQHGNTKDMIFSCEHIISYVSRYFTLKVGDLIYTGTPAGVGQVKIGDALIGSINQQELFSVKIA